MGHIYEQRGRFAIEGKRDSFILHADYGLKPYECALSEVKPGRAFRDVDGTTVYVVKAQLIGRTTVSPITDLERTGDRRNGMSVVPLGEGPAFDPIGMVEFDHPLCSIWQDHPHPEIENDDLDDLILALADYRNKLADR